MRMLLAAVLVAGVAAAGGGSDDTWPAPRTAEPFPLAKAMAKLEDGVHCFSRHRFTDVKNPTATIATLRVAVVKLGAKGWSIKATTRRNFMDNAHTEIALRLYPDGTLSHGVWHVRYDSKDYATGKVHRKEKRSTVNVAPGGTSAKITSERRDAPDAEWGEAKAQPVELKPGSIPALLLHLVAGRVTWSGTELRELQIWRQGDLEQMQLFAVGEREMFSRKYGRQRHVAVHAAAKLWSPRWMPDGVLYFRNGELARWGEWHRCTEAELDTALEASAEDIGYDGIERAGLLAFQSWVDRYPDLLISNVDLAGFKKALTARSHRLGVLSERELEKHLRDQLPPKEQPAEGGRLYQLLQFERHTRPEWVRGLGLVSWPGDDGDSMEFRLAEDGRWKLVYWRRLVEPAGTGK